MTKIKIIRNKENNQKNKTKIIDTNLKVSYRKNLIQKALGYMFKAKKDKIMIFPFNRKQIISIHTLFVKHTLYCIWLDEDKVIETKLLKPFKFYRPKKKANKLIEIPKQEYLDINKKVSIEKNDYLIIQNKA